MNKWIYRLLMIVCLGVFSFSAYNLWMIKAEQDKSNQANGQGIIDQMMEDQEVDEAGQKKKVKGFKPDWNKLQETYPDIVGWIYVPDCDCSFPVVQGADNYFYLNHAANREYNDYGAVFMNAGQPANLTDDNTIIYGHSSDDNQIMTKIYNFNDADFFNKHPQFFYFTPEQNYVCDIYVFAKDEDAGTYYETNLDAIDYGEEGDGYLTREQILQYWHDHAVYRNNIDIEGKNMLTISTCNVKEYGFFSNQRCILMGVLNPTNEPIPIKG